MESGKRKGGGLAVFVNVRWWNSWHTNIKEQHCCRDNELLAVSMRPHYLPWELSHFIAIGAFVPPSAIAEAACDPVVHSVVSRLQTQHPQALLLNSEDFNHASPSSTLPIFTQCPTCHTRDNKTLDPSLGVQRLIYVVDKNSHRRIQLSMTGLSRRVFFALWSWTKHRFSGGDDGSSWGGTHLASFLSLIAQWRHPMQHHHEAESLKYGSISPLT